MSASKKIHFRAFRVYAGLFFAGISISVAAQKHRIEWGALQRFKDRDFIEGVVDAEPGSVRLLRSRYNVLGQRSVFLDNFSGAGLEKTYEALLVDKASHKEAGIGYRTYYEDIYRINGRLVLFMSVYNPESDRNIAYGRYLNENGIPEGDVMELGEIKAERRSNRGRFGFVPSYSGKSILMYSHEPYMRYSDEKFGFSVLDSTLQLVWWNEYTLPYKDRDFTIVRYEADDSANVFMLTRVYLTLEQRRERNLENDSYYFALLEFRPDDERHAYREKILHFEGKYLLNIHFRINPRQDKIFTGFYAEEKAAPNEVSGLYYFVIPYGKSEPEQIHFHKFEEGFVPNFGREVSLRYGERGEPGLDIRGNFLFPDGSMAVVAEHNMISEYCYTDYRTAITTCTYNYYFHDIFVFCISPNGEVKWKIKIPKRQFTRNDYGIYSSFAAAQNRNKIYILYNEKPRTPGSENRRPEVMNDPRKSSAVWLTIDRSGHVKKEILFQNSERKTWLRPHLCVQSSRKEMLLFTNRGNQFMWGRIRLED